MYLSSPNGGSIKPHFSEEEVYISRFNSKNEDKEHGIGAGFRSFCGALRLGITYTAADVFRRPRNCCIGMITVLLIILFTGAVMLTVTKGSFVILRLAELSVSEMDVILNGEVKGEATVNYTDIEQRLRHVTCLRGVAPRWIVPVFLKKYQDPNVRESKKLLSTRASLLVIDSDVENEIGLGRGWPHRVTGYSEAHVHESILTLTELRPNRGERIHMSMPLDTMLPMLGANESIRVDDLKMLRNLTDFARAGSFGMLNLIALSLFDSLPNDSVSLTDVLKMNFGINVAENISKSMGKFPSIFGNVIVMDYHHLIPTVLDASCLNDQRLITAEDGRANVFNGVTESVRHLSQVDIRSHAMFLAMVLENRRNVYGSHDRIAAMVDCSNSIMQAVGLDYRGRIAFPVSYAFKDFENIAAILNATLLRTAVEAAVLGGILLFALLQVNADERQYEVALMRTQGFAKVQLLVLILFQSLAFVIPGVLIGTGLLVSLHVLIENFLETFTRAPSQPFDIPLVPFFLAVGLGIVLPAIATWLPVSRALSDSLRNAMDIYRQSKDEAKVVMMRLENIGLTLWQVFLGIFLTVFGFIVYYMIPFSFVFQEVQLFFVLINVILLVTIVGFCMIMYALEPYAETFFSWLMLWGKEKRLSTLIAKNLEDHRSTNSKAFMMFLLSVTSVVASGVITAILAQSAQQMMQLAGGADFVVRSDAFAAPLDVPAFDAALRRWRGRGAIAWAYRGFPLDHYPQVSGSTRIASAIGIEKRAEIIPLSETFLHAVYPDVVSMTAESEEGASEKTRDGVADVVGSMYKKMPSAVRRSKVAGVTTGFPVDREKPKVSAKTSIRLPMMGPVSLKDTFGVDVGGGMFLNYAYKLENESAETTFYLQVQALMNSLPGFPELLSVLGMESERAVFLPEPAFKKLLDPTLLDFGNGKTVEIASNAITDIVPKYLYVRLDKGLSRHDRSLLLNSLEAISEPTKHVIFDPQTDMSKVEVVAEFINYFFYFNSFVCILLCTLLIWVTFSANVQLNAWSIGVLRSIGFCKSQVIRATLYEAFSVVFSAFVLGTTVGVTIGTILGLQLASLLVLPFHLPFPYILIAILFGMVIISALAGSILPHWALSKKKISHILKSL